MKAWPFLFLDCLILYLLSELIVSQLLPHPPPHPESQALSEPACGVFSTSASGTLRKAQTPVKLDVCVHSLTWGDPSHSEPCTSCLLQEHPCCVYWNCRRWLGFFLFFFGHCEYCEKILGLQSLPCSMYDSMGVGLYIYIYAAKEVLKRSMCIHNILI